MFIDERRRFVFIHNPKTAGTSILSALGAWPRDPSPLSHITLREFARRMPDAVSEDMFTFAFVRHPVTRYRSLWGYHRSPAYGRLFDRNFSHRLALNNSFEDWVRYNLSTRPRARWFGVAQRSWWMGVSRAYKFEEIKAAWEDIQKTIGFAADLPVINSVSEAGEGRVALSQDSAKSIMQIDHATCQRFVYR